MTYSIDEGDGMQRAIAWTREHLDRIKEGGVWIVPRSYGIYRINHGFKQVERIGSEDESIERVIKSMGWEVLK